MGATLVKAAFAVLAARPDISAPARLVLLKMALTAKDTDATPLFWGGRDELAQAAGYPIGAAESAAAHRRVTRLVSTLVNGGLIERDGRAKPGRNQAYKLVLGVTTDHPLGESESDDLAAMGVTTDHPFGCQDEPPMKGNGCHPGAPMGVTTDHPEEQIEEPSTTRTHASGFAEEAPLVGSDEDAMHADDDDPYLEARRTLLTLDPERVEAAQQRVNVDMPHASTRDRVMATLRVLEEMAS